MCSSFAASFMVLLICFLVSAATFNFISLCSGADQPVSVNTCSSKDRQALLALKQGLTDPSNRLSSWSIDYSEDCCWWAGVHCHNITGAVTELHLQYFYLGGNISPSLLQLESLTYLDLSWNDFQGTPIPSFFGSMTSLRYLNLDSASFGGLIPSQLQNLSSIHYLNLGNEHGLVTLHADSLGWIARLRTLEYLEMSAVDLHGVEADWLQMVSMLPSLSELHFSDCKIDSMIPPLLGHVNFSSLQVLDLSFNRFSSRIPDWLFNLTSSITELDLSYNSLYGVIPARIGQLKHLESLSLIGNKLSGSIPWSISNLTSLRELFLSHNQLDGTVPDSIWLLSNIEVLSIAWNPIPRIIVSEEDLAKLPNLKVLALSSTFLSVSIDPRWTPPFNLESIYLPFSNIGPGFPLWLRSQTSLQYLDLSMSGISDTAPDWFWELASGFYGTNLAGNGMQGDLTHVLFNSSSVDISSNRFKGQLPQISSNVQSLSVGNNTLSGKISTFICRETHRNNALGVLDISNNNLSGELSDCWMHWQYLTHLNLGSNNFVGMIPATIGSLSNLQALQLSQNRLSGDIPPSLKNFTQLSLINLGENELTGYIPTWMGEWKAVVVIGLRSNKFSGKIPLQLCQLASIRVLDLSNNNLSGAVPKCLSNFRFMVDGATEDPSINIGLEYVDFNTFKEPLELVTKGTESTYKNILRFVRLIDFSNNRLSGTIPTGLSKLSGLRFLNLSRNHLVGEIPKNVGNMTNLESLDLSRNQLSGEIPESMSKLSFLNHLDLSYNNLSGNIPLSTQLQSFNESSFLGNAGLCGAPLPKHCRNDTLQEPKPSSEEDAEEIDDNMFWFYIGVGPGFTCAFSGVCATLYFNTAWREALFQFLEQVMNRIKRRRKRSGLVVV